MNIDFEITGKIAKRNDRELEVRIYFDGVLADNFERVARKEQYIKGMEV